MGRNKNAYDPHSDPIAVVQDPPLDDKPTRTLPGSEERICVYADRVARGRRIFHPDDRALPDRIGYAPSVHDDRLRGKIVKRKPRKVVEVKNQQERPEPSIYLEGPGAAARRERMRLKQKTPEQKARDAARNKAARAFRRKAAETATLSHRMKRSSRDPLGHLIRTGMEVLDNEH